MKHEENTAAEVERTKSASMVTSENDGTEPTPAGFGGENVPLVGTGVRVSESEKPPSAAVTTAEVTTAEVTTAEVMTAEVTTAEVAEAASPSGKTPDATKRQGNANGPSIAGKNLRKLRIERMMSKAELARRANLSVLTIDRIEKGFGCRMDSKRKILEALGLSLGDRVRVFGEEE